MKFLFSFLFFCGATIVFADIQKVMPNNDEFSNEDLNSRRRTNNNHNYYNNEYYHNNDDPDSIILSDNHSSKKYHPCYLCTDKNSVVGLTDKVASSVHDTTNNNEEDDDLLTCGMMEVALKRIDLTKLQCDIFQSYAELFCSCTTSDDSSIDNNSGIIDNNSGIIESDEKSTTYPDYKIRKDDYQTVLVRSYNGTTTTTQDDNVESSSTVQAFANVLLFIFVLGIIVTVPVGELREQFHNKSAMFIGLSTQFLILPFISFLLVIFLDNEFCCGDDTSPFTQPMGIALIITMASPGGSFSNLWVSLFNADIALSVALTFASTVISILMLPMNTLFYSYITYGLLEDKEKKLWEQHDQFKDNLENNFEFKSFFLPLGIILLALSLGILISWRYQKSKYKKSIHRIAKVTALISAICLFSLTGYLLLKGTHKRSITVWNKHWEFYAALLIIVVVTIWIPHITAVNCTQLSKSEIVALAIECCFRNTKIAISIVLSMFTEMESQTQALGVIWTYTFMASCSVLVYSLFAWKLGWTKAPPNENLLVVIISTYDENENSNKDANELLSVITENESGINAIADDDLASTMRLELESQSKRKGLY